MTSHEPQPLDVYAVVLLDAPLGLLEIRNVCGPSLKELNSSSIDRQNPNTAQAKMNLQFISLAAGSNLKIQSIFITGAKH